ncbi:MAG: 3-oxo-5-alpha-steroid 4-dehydrogenase, partial [Myxococcota bacterium]|nr:3-oxo-5-alpha-steroid 4-dehydrogenase [Myxococcota bacterium]
MILDRVLHDWLVGIEVGLALVTFLALLLVVAPYGRHSRGGWGPTLPNRLGWVLMESPAVLLFAFFFFCGSKRFELVPLLLLGLW